MTWAPCSVDSWWARRGSIRRRSRTRAGGGAEPERWVGVGPAGRRLRGSFGLSSDVALQGYEFWSGQYLGHVPGGRRNADGYTHPGDYQDL